MTDTSIDVESCESFSGLLPNTVDLSDASIIWATQVAKAISDADEQWENFLQALAIAGFKQWLGKGEISFKSTDPPKSRQALRPTLNFQVGDYQLCIIAMGSWFESSVEVFINSPVGIGNNGQRLAHLYVLVEVYEEINQIYITGGLTQKQLIRRIGGIQAVRQQQVINVPVSAFDVSPEKILLYLSCLEPAVFVRAEPGRNYAQTISDGIINAGAWLKNTVDEVCEQLNWALLPPFATAMRSARDDMHRVLQVLSTQGVLLPVKAKGIGGPIKVGSFTCQIYAWVWTVDTHQGTEWVLFFLLGPQDGAYLPAGLQLQVTDCSEVLTEGMLERPSNEAYLYTQVQGGFEEEFLVRIILPNGVRMALPTFNFETI